MQKLQRKRLKKETKNMENIIKYSDFEVEISTSEVMNLLQCDRENPCYEEFQAEYEEIKEELISLGKPQALFCFDQMPETGEAAVFVLITEGSGMSRYSTEMFEQGDYVKGMIADAAAGSYLFELEKQALECLKEECAKRGVGIIKRLEAPVDMPMEMQQIIFEKCRAKEELGMKISSGFMFDPVKSSGIIFLLSEDTDVFRAQHDCSKCTAVNCKMRKVSENMITVERDQKEFSVHCREGQTIMEALTAHDQYFSAFCGGTGRCGKCRVRIVEGNFPETPEDRNFFTEKELGEGWRLACKAVPDGDCRISFDLNDEEAFEATADTVDNAEKKEDGVYGIACDIGTTTIAMSLLDMESGAVHAVTTSVNHQRMYGADVISRIQASNEGKGGILQESIRRDLCKGIRELLQKGEIEKSQVQKIVLAGNTTMEHLLLGYSCETLGVFPFTPVNIGTVSGTCEEILGEAAVPCETVMMPGISTYVGADIAAGILSCGMTEREEITLLIDIGTNGEMAIGNREKILVTSTAAGPAFEGGNISCGMGSIPGAISGVDILDGEVKITTIGNEPPAGLCGTGVIETMAELVKAELVDETGLMDEDLDDEFLLGHTPKGEEICFTDRDVREVQLAKAAVRAGMETLLLRYGVTAEQVSKVYLAGGFGLKIDQEKAIAIGMLPEAFRGKTEAVGNSSLKGAAKYLLEKADEKTEEIIRISEEISLSSDRDFNELYMEHMFF